MALYAKIQILYAEIKKMYAELKQVKESKVNNNKSIVRFTPPSLNDVARYWAKRKNGIDAESFVAFYESKGWMIGNNRMKDWKAAVRTWERRGTKESRPQGKQNQFNQFSQRDYDMKELEKKLLEK